MKMKNFIFISAVQSERDRITSSRKQSGASSGTQISLNNLLRAEKICSQLPRSTVILDSATAAQRQEPGSQRPASLNDISDAMKRQLLLLVDWAKVITPFVSMALDDQVL